MKKLTAIIILGALVSCTKESYETDVHIHAKDVNTLEGVDGMRCEIYSGNAHAAGYTSDGKCHLNFESNYKSADVYMTINYTEWALIQGDLSQQVQSDQINIVNLSLARKGTTQFNFAEQGAGTPTYLKFKLTPTDSIYVDYYDHHFDWRQYSAWSGGTTTISTDLPEGRYIMEWESNKNTGTVGGSDTVDVVPGLNQDYYLSY